MRDTACGVDIPEMTVIPDAGVTMVITDVDIWDDLGNQVTGKSYELTDANNDRLVIQIHEAVQVSPGVKGHFYFEYRGQRTSDLDFSTPALGDYAASELRKIHADLGNVEIDYNGNCNEGWNFNINWGMTGDYETIKLVNINITGVDPVFESADIRSGGVWVRELPGAYLATVSTVPQVQVERNGILAVCNNDAVFYVGIFSVHDFLKI